MLGLGAASMLAGGLAWSAGNPAHSARAFEHWMRAVAFEQGGAPASALEQVRLARVYDERSQALVQAEVRLELETGALAAAGRTLRDASSPESSELRAWRAALLGDQGGLRRALQQVDPDRFDLALPWRLDRAGAHVAALELVDVAAERGRRGAAEIAGRLRAREHHRPALLRARHDLESALEQTQDLALIEALVELDRRVGAATVAADRAEVWLQLDPLAPEAWTSALRTALVLEDGRASRLTRTALDAGLLSPVQLGLLWLGEGRVDLPVRLHRALVDDGPSGAKALLAVGTGRYRRARALLAADPRWRDAVPLAVERALEAGLGLERVERSVPRPEGFGALLVRAPDGLGPEDRDLVATAVAMAPDDPLGLALMAMVDRAPGRLKRARRLDPGLPAWLTFERSASP